MNLTSSEAGAARQGELSGAPPVSPATAGVARGLRPIAWVLDHLEEGIVAALLLFMTGLAFANVVVRYLTTSSLAFSEELLVNLFVWLSLFGAAIGVRRKAHATVDLIVQSLPPALRLVARIFAYACSALAAAIVVWQGAAMARFQHDMGAETYSMALPSWWFALGVPLGAAAILVRLAQAGWRDVRGDLARLRGSKA